MNNKFDAIKLIRNNENPENNINNQTDNFSCKKNILKNIFVYILALFLAVNTAIYTTVIVKSVAFGPHKQAKFILSNSMFITMYYICPLGKLFGPDAPILTPLRSVRDKLYYTGIKYLPEDDAESEMWWYSTRYQEFRKLYPQKINEYIAGNISADEANINYLLSFTDEMYSHIKKMANLSKLGDDNFKELRLKIFANQIAFYYVNQKSLLLIKYNSGIIPASEIKRFENILKWYFSLKEFCKINEKKGYDFVFNNPKTSDSESILVYLTTSLILKNQILENKNICNTEFLKLNRESKTVLIQFAEKQNGNSYINRLLQNKIFDFSTIIEQSNKCEMK